MQQLTKDLKSIPGVIGASVYRSKQGIVANTLPTSFKQDQLLDIAKLLVKINAAGRLNFPDLGEVLLSFDESVVLCRQLNSQDFLIAICEPSINMNLLAMSMNLAIEELGQGELPTSAKAADARSNSSSPAPTTPTVSRKTLRTSPPLATPLQVMEELLNNVMGPMAAIVFEDALDIWIKSVVPAPATLPKLLEIICQEFGDDEKARIYRDLVRSRLSSRGKKN